MSTSTASTLAKAKQLSDSRVSNRKDVDIPSQTGSPSANQQNPHKLMDDVSTDISKLSLEEEKSIKDDQSDTMDSNSLEPVSSTSHALTQARTKVAQFVSPSIIKLLSGNTIPSIPAIRHDAMSWYTPNCICLFEILAEMELLIHMNKQLQLIAPDYFSLPVRVYYAVIFYVHILNVRAQPAYFQSEDDFWLRSFNRQFPKTDLPIAGPLLAFFSSITYCLPEDEQFNYVYPTVPTNGTYSSVNSGTNGQSVRTTTVHSVHHLFPCVPFLVSMLRKFCLSSSFPDDMFDSKEQFVPFNLATGSGPDGFAGVNFPPHEDNTPNPTTAALLSNPALSRPFPESKSALKDIHVHWRNSYANDASFMNIVDSYDPRSLNDQVLSTDDFGWFRSCINAAAKQTLFFSHSSTLSQVSIIGDPSCIVESKLTFTNYPTIPTVINEWYPRIYSNVTAKFRATSSNLTTEMQEAATFAVSNASLKWKDSNDQPIGSLLSKSRNGPYFENKKYTYMSIHDSPVLPNISTTLKSYFYQPLHE